MEAADLTLTGSFDCGITVLNEWLQCYAWQNHQSGGARVYLTVESRRKLIGGYYCLSAAQADYREASQRVSKGLSRNPIPVVLIGRFAGKPLRNSLRRFAVVSLRGGQTVIATD